MGECPSKECHERVIGHHRTLYGLDGTGGIVGCMKQFVKKKTVWIALIAIGIPLIVTGIKVWSSQEQSVLKYATIECITDLDKRITRNEDRFEYIDATMTRIERIQNEIKKEIKKMNLESR